LSNASEIVGTERSDRRRHRRYSSPVAAVWTTVRLAITVIVGVVVIGATLTDGCNDNDGPSWERCTSPLGNATLEWRGHTAWIPYLIGVVVGCVTWFLLEFARRLWVEAQARLEATGDI
jgi:hypothetical protein